MSKLTIREKLTQILVHKGFVVLPSHHKVRACLSRDIEALQSLNATNLYIFLGKAGGIRKGNCYTKSHSLNHLRKNLLAQWELKFGMQESLK